MKAKWILSTQEVYPGDDLNADHEAYEERFSVTRSKKDSYLIKDYWGNFRVRIPIALLENPLFDIRGWYAKRKAKALHLKKPKMPYYPSVSLCPKYPKCVIGWVHSHYPSMDFT